MSSRPRSRKIITVDRSLVWNTGLGAWKPLMTFDKAGRYRINKIDIIITPTLSEIGNIVLDGVLAFMHQEKGTNMGTGPWIRYHFLDGVHDLLGSGQDTDNCLWWTQWSIGPQKIQNASGYTVFGIPQTRVDSKGDKFRWVNYYPGDALITLENCSTDDNDGSNYTIILDMTIE